MNSTLEVILLHKLYNKIIIFYVHNHELTIKPHEFKDSFFFICIIIFIITIAILNRFPK